MFPINEFSLLIRYKLIFLNMFKIKTIFLAFCCCFFVTIMSAQQIKTVCYGATKTYFVDLDDGANGTIGSSYEWTILEPNSAIINGNGTNRVSIDWALTAPGNYTIQVLETNESCMSSTSTLSIRIKANPVISAQGTTICENFSGTISVNAFPTASTLQYSWAFPPGASDPGNVASFETSVSGDYIVSAKDNHGCISNVATATLVVNSLPSATVVADGATKFCEGGTLVLLAPAGMSSYIWSKDDVVINNGTTSDRLLTVDSSGSYGVTIVDSKGCTNNTESPIFVDVKPLPAVDILLSGATEFCFGNNVKLTANATGNGLVYQWLDKGIEMVNKIEDNFIAFDSSSYSVKVIDDNACESISDIVDVIVRPVPDATITHNTPTTFCPGDRVVLSVPSVEGYSYQWSDFRGNILGATNSTYIATESSDYSVTIIDTNYPIFCTSTAMMPVKVIKKILPIISVIEESE